MRDERAHTQPHPQSFDIVDCHYQHQHNVDCRKKKPLYFRYKMLSCISQRRRRHFYLPLFNLMLLAGDNKFFSSANWVSSRLTPNPLLNQIATRTETIGNNFKASKMCVPMTRTLLPHELPNKTTVEGKTTLHFHPRTTYHIIDIVRSFFCVVSRSWFSVGRQSIFVCCSFFSLSVGVRHTDWLEDPRHPFPFSAAFRSPTSWLCVVLVKRKVETRAKEVDQFVKRAESSCENFINH